jgi:hypothetical protein
MVHPPSTPEWIHRGCRIRLCGPHGTAAAYRIHHGRSGLPLGTTTSLEEARRLIDERIVLVRQRLAATA